MRQRKASMDDRLKWKILERQNMDAVECVCAMGEDAMRFYISLNKKWKVYPFIYYTCENETHTPMICSMTTSAAEYSDAVT